MSENTFLNGLFGGANELLGGIGNSLGGVDPELLALISSGVLSATGALDPKIPKTGYQGGIPDYTAVRQQLPQLTNGAPLSSGSVVPTASGRRYFTDTNYQLNNPQLQAPGYAQGGEVGIAALPAGANFLGGSTDGLSDSVPAVMNAGGTQQQAALSDGEFVLPADIVSHLGNGNSSAGAEMLYGMMEKLRTQRTGSPDPGQKINPQQFLPG